MECLLHMSPINITGAGANIPKNARVLLAIYIFVAPKLTRVADKLKIATEQGNESLF